MNRKTRIRARLERARSQGLLVAVRRRTPEASLAKGFVTAVGRRWVALAVLNDQIRIDGWMLLRLREVLAVAIRPDPDCYQIRALKARSQWPVPEGDFSLDDFVGAATSAAAMADVVGIGVGTPTVRYFVGTVRSATPSGLQLQPLTPKGVWRVKTKELQARDVVLLDVADSHVAAYRAMAGPPPPVGGAAATKTDSPSSVERPAGGQGSVGGRRAVSAQVIEAFRDGALVTLHRGIPEADTVTGVVVDVGTQWVAVSKIGSDFAWDGWALIPLNSISGCRRIATRPWGRLVAAAHRLRGTVTAPVPSVGLDSVGEVLRAAADRFPLVTVNAEYAWPELCWIGALRVVDQQTVSLWSIDSRANWGDAPWLIDVADITRIDVGGDYENALWLASGDRLPPGLPVTH